jgi:hypothetical protein
MPVSAHYGSKVKFVILSYRVYNRDSQLPKGLVMENFSLVDVPEIQAGKPKKNHSIWRFYVHKSVLLYISQKPNASTLMKEPWWRDVDYIKLEHFTSLDDVIEAKDQAIIDEDPKWNLRGRRGDVD